MRNPHHTARGDIYQQVIERFEKNREIAREGLVFIAKIAPYVSETIEQLQEVLAATSYPPREWTSAIGLSATIYVNGAKSRGSWHLKVMDGIRGAPFLLQVWDLDTKKSVEWYPDCGYSGTEAMVRVGLWRHPPCRIFGLSVDQTKDGT